jgi:ribosome-associated protein
MEKLLKALKKIENQISSEILRDSIVEGMQDNKGKDIVILDLRKVENAVTDFFVICTGDSSVQIEGIANSVVRNTRKELKERPWNQHGKGISEWVLLDYVSVVAHVFSKSLRDYYSLEDLWADAVRTEIPDLN